MQDWHAAVSDPFAAFAAARDAAQLPADTPASIADDLSDAEILRLKLAPADTRCADV